MSSEQKAAPAKKNDEAESVNGTPPHPSPAATPSPRGEGSVAAGRADTGTGPGRENKQLLSEAEYGAPGSPVAGMRRIRSDAELPREVLDYVELVESDEPRSCKDQLALAAYVRRTFRTEEIYIDTERLEKDLSLQRYFPFDLFPWQRFLVALWLCTFAPDGFPRWDTLLDMQSRGSGKDGFIAYCAMCLTSPYNPVPFYDVDICGNDEVQAVRPMKDLIRVLEKRGQAAKLNRYYHHTKETVDGLRNGGAVHGWANNAKNRDGLRSGVVIFNEVHQYVSYDNVSVFTSGLGKTPEPRTGIFTSNGKVSDGPLDSWLQQRNAVAFVSVHQHIDLHVFW